MASTEEEILGKAYDSRLMKRLLTYLRPYRGHVVIALIAIVFKASLDVLGPFLTKTAIDKYLAHTPGTFSILDRWLSPTPLIGIAQIAAVYMATLLLSFGLEYLQTYFMQWTGQKVMFDLRSQIFRHLQRMHVAFFDKNPVGRLVTRVTTDVDALNEMFTAGVVSIFEDMFRSDFHFGHHAEHELEAGVDHVRGASSIICATKIFRDQRARFVRRIRTRDGPDQCILAGSSVRACWCCNSSIAKKRAYQQFSKINASHMEAFKDAIMAYSVYYPVVEILSVRGDRMHHLVGRSRSDAAESDRGQRGSFVFRGKTYSRSRSPRKE